MTQKLKLIAFPGAPNLPIFVAREMGWFERHGVDLAMSMTPSSAYQAEALAKGECDIAGTAFDNIVAYTQGQGAIVLDPAPDFFAFMGATEIELAIVAGKDIASIPALAGKSLALDAPGTGFAFVLYHMLEKGGLAPGAYERVAIGATPQRWEAVRSGAQAATMTIEPFTSIAKAQGFNILARSTETIADYQGGAFASRRSWARRNEEAIKGFIRAYLAGLAWTLDPGNCDAAAESLLRNMAEIKPPVVGAVMASLLSPRSGLTPEGRLTMAGIRALLDLRLRYGKPGADLGDPQNYIDLTYYDAAVAGG